MEQSGDMRLKPRSWLPHLFNILRKPAVRTAKEWQRLLLGIKIPFQMSFKKSLSYHYHYGTINGYCVEVGFNRHLKTYKKVKYIINSEPSM